MAFENRWDGRMTHVLEDREVTKEVSLVVHKLFDKLAVETAVVARAKMFDQDRFGSEVGFLGAFADPHDGKVPLLRRNDHPGFVQN